MRKYKHFQDAEYTIIGASVDAGVDSSQFTWIRETENGTQFNVKPVGTNESKSLLFADSEKYIGSRLTVKYQELSGDGIPRFPIGKGIRGDDE